MLTGKPLQSFVTFQSPNKKNKGLGGGVCVLLLLLVSKEIKVLTV